MPMTLHQGKVDMSLVARAYSTSTNLLHVLRSLHYPVLPGTLLALDVSGHQRKGVLYSSTNSDLVCLQI